MIKKGLYYSLWTSRDLCFVIIFAALGAVYAALVVQTAYFTAIPGATFFFLIVFAIFISTQLLLYQGRRWRFFVSTTLFTILTIPIPFAGPAFDVLARTPLIIGAFIGDLLFNTMYEFVKKHNKLLWLTVLFSLQYHLMNSVFSIMIYYLFYPPEALTSYISVISFVLPVIIVESIAGGYIGYKVYERLKNFQNRCG